MTGNARFPYVSLMLAGATLIFSQPAMAQETPDPYQGTAYDGDYLTIGAGAVYGPSYEGSDDYIIYPGGALNGSLGGVSFQTRGLGLAVDIAPDADNAKVGFIAGPTVQVNLNRTNDSDIEDARVERLGELDTAVEVGAEMGFQVNRLLNPYDNMSLTMGARWDVAGAHEGRILSPRLSYFTPLSQGMAASLSVNAEHMDDDYADYYFSVSGAGSAASGLAPFQAEEGWKSVGAGLFLGLDLNGNLADGGFGLFAAGNYSRLLNDAKDSPLTSQAGDADQWRGALGIGYTF